MQEWYLGWEKVSCLERCPQFRSVRERGSTVLYMLLTHPFCLFESLSCYVSHSLLTLCYHLVVSRSVVTGGTVPCVGAPDWELRHSRERDRGRWSGERATHLSVTTP